MADGSHFEKKPLNGQVYFTSITAAILDFFKILPVTHVRKMEPYFFLISIIFLTRIRCKINFNKQKKQNYKWTCTITSCILNGSKK